MAELGKFAGVKSSKHVQLWGKRELSMKWGDAQGSIMPGKPGFGICILFSVQWKAMTWFSAEE